MAIIFTKTANGQHEIETRARRLSPRARSALILVDGKRSDEELGKMIQQADETLRSLLEAGLIEVLASSKDRSEPAAGAAGSQATPDPVPPDLIETQRRDAVRAVNDLLGPEAEALAVRIERAKGRDELRAALERAAEYIANARGAAVASQFSSRFLRTLPR